MIILYLVSADEGLRAHFKGRVPLPLQRTLLACFYCRPLRENISMKYPQGAVGHQMLVDV